MSSYLAIVPEPTSLSKVLLFVLASNVSIMVVLGCAAASSNVTNLPVAASLPLLVVFLLLMSNKNVERVVGVLLFFYFLAYKVGFMHRSV